MTHVLAKALHIIRKTRTCNEYPLNPTVIQQNWGVQGYTYFLFLTKTIEKFSGDFFYLFIFFYS